MQIVLDDEVHVSSWPWKSVLWRKTRVQRRATMQLQDAFPICAYLLATVELQRFWRGILLRRRVLAKYLHRNFRREWRKQEAQTMEEYRALPRPVDDQFLPCLKRLQARIRCCLMRREYVRWMAYEKYPIYFIAAVSIQRTWHDYRYKKYKIRSAVRTRLMYLSREDACAARIQGAWKRFIQRQIFQFYVDLIKFRERGDPQLMLKCINPREASLMDAASGVHVRFRLGGGTFPPTIFYKIFAHSPIADIGAFAPKDYTTARKKLPPSVVHNKVPVPMDDRSRWYQRVDNNEWRPICDKILQNAEAIVADREAPYTIPKTVKWHYSKLKRKEEAVKDLKRKRRQWLMELYTQEQEAQGLATKEKIQEDANKLFATMTDDELEEEVERLVQWTRDLDFKEYRNDWLVTATTAGSDYETLPPNAIADNGQ
eukprot:Sspe_Gene.118481::Locus_112104_Transcript_1_1_Confidence_1.000_Length_1356::g.118481::m.118481